MSGEPPNVSSSQQAESAMDAALLLFKNATCDEERFVALMMLTKTPIEDKVDGAGVNSSFALQSASKCYDVIRLRFIVRLLRTSLKTEQHNDAATSSSPSDQQQQQQQQQQQLSQQPMRSLALNMAAFLLQAPNAVLDSEIGALLELLLQCLEQDLHLSSDGQAWGSTSTPPSTPDTADGLSMQPLTECLRILAANPVGRTLLLRYGVADVLVQATTKQDSPVLDVTSLEHCLDAMLCIAIGPEPSNLQHCSSESRASESAAHAIAPSNIVLAVANATAHCLSRTDNAAFKACAVLAQLLHHVQHVLPETHACRRRLALQDASTQTGTNSAEAELPWLSQLRLGVSKLLTSRLGADQRAQVLGLMAEALAFARPSWLLITTPVQQQDTKRKSLLQILMSVASIELRMRLEDPVVSAAAQSLQLVLSCLVITEHCILAITSAVDDTAPASTRSTTDPQDDVSVQFASVSFALRGAIQAALAFLDTAWALARGQEAEDIQASQQLIKDQVRQQLAEARQRAANIIAKAKAQAEEQAGGRLHAAAEEEAARIEEITAHSIVAGNMGPDTVDQTAPPSSSAGEGTDAPPASTLDPLTRSLVPACLRLVLLYFKEDTDTLPQEVQASLPALFGWIGLLAGDDAQSSHRDNDDTDVASIALPALCNFALEPKAYEALRTSAVLPQVVRHVPEHFRSKASFLGNSLTLMINLTVPSGQPLVSEELRLDMLSAIKSMVNESLDSSVSQHDTYLADSSVAVLLDQPLLLGHFVLWSIRSQTSTQQLEHHDNARVLALFCFVLSALGCAAALGDNFEQHASTLHPQLRTAGRGCLDELNDVLQMLLLCADSLSSMPCNWPSVLGTTSEIRIAQPSLHSVQCLSEAASLNAQHLCSHPDGPSDIPHGIASMIVLMERAVTRPTQDLVPQFRHVTAQLWSFLH